MTSGSFCFDRFVLDAGDRQLRRDGTPVELNSRYFDALALLVSQQGKLVSKDRFLDEVWRGVPVTDEALTQCIKTLRRQLGDEAGRPRFIETVPKHGYRFIAPVDQSSRGPVGATAKRGYSWREFFLLGSAGTIGGGIAGFIGGLIYGFAAASQPQQSTGAISVLLVMMCLTIAVALIGAAGVSFGIAASGFMQGRPAWPIVGGAAGGLLVGAAVKLLGLDAFKLVIGHSPGDITGAGEGLVIGAAVGLAAWFGSRGARRPPLRRSVAIASVVGGAAGIAIILLGGRMMGGSLDLLARSFPDSQLRLDAIGAIFGERRFGRVTELITGGLEGALFSACVVGAMILAQRSLGASD